jgi:hypothetical protein
MRIGQVLAALLCVLGCQVSTASQLEIKSAFARSAVEQRPVSLTVPLGGGFNLTALAEVTTKGNGTLTIGNLALHMQDLHDDGLIYDGDGLLRLDVERLGIDRPNARAPALIVSGILVRTGEKETDPVSRAAITTIYVLDCRSGQFKRVFSNNDLDIDLGTARDKRIACPKR